MGAVKTLWAWDIALGRGIWFVRIGLLGVSVFGWWLSGLSEVVDPVSWAFPCLRSGQWPTMLIVYGLGALWDKPS